jgi:hypothetical protein
MRRVITVLGASAVAIGLAAPPASADVHGVSQAGCSGNPKAGATQSRDAEGRPSAPIPVMASPVWLTTVDFPGKGGDGDPACDVPPGPPKNG